jgi:hypothetical protein
VGECEGRARECENGRLHREEDSLRVANFLVARPVSFLTIFPAIKDLLAPGTNGKLRVCFQFFTTLTSNKLARFLVRGPVRFLALGIAIPYSFAARTRHVLGFHLILIMPPFTALTDCGTSSQREFFVEASSRRPSLIDSFYTLVGNEPTFGIRTNWNTCHFIDLVTTLIADIMAFSGHFWCRGLRTHSTLEIRVRLSQLSQLLKEEDVFLEFGDEVIVHAPLVELVVLGYYTDWQFQTLGSFNQYLALL